MLVIKTIRDTIAHALSHLLYKKLNHNSMMRAWPAGADKICNEIKKPQLTRSNLTVVVQHNNSIPLCTMTSYLFIK